MCLPTRSRFGHVSDVSDVLADLERLLNGEMLEDFAGPALTPARWTLACSGVGRIDCTDTFGEVSKEGDLLVLCPDWRDLLSIDDPQAEKPRQTDWARRHVYRESIVRTIPASCSSRSTLTKGGSLFTNSYMPWTTAWRTQPSLRKGRPPKTSSSL